MRSANTRSSPGAPLGELKPVTPPNLDDDFEVIDDIDDHAPDPTRGQGGLRVLLATLLVIAIVVLLALQFI